MEIKGTAVKSIPEFVRKNFPERFDEWWTNLPEESGKILNESVTSGWYPIKAAAIDPTRLIGQMFYNDVNKGAWESGRFSAEIALTGIYKIYVKLSTPWHIIERASRILQAYYNPCEIEVSKKRSNWIIVNITYMGDTDLTIENRIGGWIEKALEISGCKNLQVKKTKSLSSGNPVTEFDLQWA